MPDWQARQVLEEEGHMRHDVIDCKPEFRGHVRHKDDERRLFGMARIPQDHGGG